MFIWAKVRKSRIIVLTGSIGSGKSHACKILGCFGFRVWNADKVVHKLLEPRGIAFSKVSSLFPQALCGNKIDRNLLGKIVFAHSEKLRQLESVLHPLVTQDRNDFIDWAKRNHQNIVLEIPLYFETKIHIPKAIVMVTNAPFFLRKIRVMQRPGMTTEKFHHICSQQTTDSYKKRHADFVIQTGLSYRETTRQIMLFLNMLNKETFQQT